MWDIIKLLVQAAFRWVLSLVGAIFHAFIGFLQDLLADIIDSITLWVWGKLLGVEINIPTVSQALSHLPTGVLEVLYLIGIPECFRIMSVAIAAKSLYWGWKWYSLFRGGW